MEINALIARINELAKKKKTSGLTPEELAENKTVKEKYLTTSFVLRKKDFQLLDEQKKARDKE